MPKLITSIASKKAVNKNLNKARLIKEIKSAIKGLEMVRAGKKSVRNAEVFLKELN